MFTPFEVLAGFLDRFGDEVEGREFVEPPQDIQVKLRALAQGSLPETERDQFFTLLNRNPEWVARLAEEVKSLRAKPEQRG